MEKIKSRLVVDVAKQLLHDKNMITQGDVHVAIERILKRHLSSGEKRRITAILQREYNVKKVVHKSGYKIFYFAGE